MNPIKRTSVIESLRELSDRSTQRRLWLSSGASEVSSFAEAVEQLFTDTGLGDALDKGQTGLGALAEAALSKLDSALRKVDRSMGPDRLIDSPQMAAVRALASAALTLVDVPE